MTQFHSDKFNVVRLLDSFTYRGQLCLEFEKLDMNLSQFVQRNHNHVLDLTLIRPLVQQLATAMEFLRGLGVVHADIKPSNIMVLDHQQKPVQFKVIDFGLACVHPERKTGAKLQSGCYRSPEVMLGCPFNEAIDIWSLGCVTAKVLLGKTPFLGGDDFELMRDIVAVLGRPPDHMLSTGLYTPQFSKLDIFQLDSAVQSSKSFCGDERNTRNVTPSDLGPVPSEVCGEDVGDERFGLIDLITQMLSVDPARRISPELILSHPFITDQQLVNISGDNPKVQLLMEQLSRSQGVAPPSDDSSYVTASLPSSDCTEDSCDWLSAKEHPYLLEDIIYEESPETERGAGAEEESLCTSRTEDGGEPTRQTGLQRSTGHQRRTDEGDDDHGGQSVNLKNICPAEKRRRVEKVLDVSERRITRSSARIQSRLNQEDPAAPRKRSRKRKNISVTQE
ncbi:homeodomain-interacting protein kinase 2 isoform X2 [Cynoglossus semilaevis]|nr:homeodomain-interacting protein kinase 2 isoform X2 [Cynoglossus semilaevis]